MSTPVLYRGVWPQNVGKLAKYAVRSINGTWQVTVLYEAGDGLRFLAVEGGSRPLADRINAVKTAMQQSPGGAFYVNEYRHVIVPVKGAPASGFGSHYYYAGQLDNDFTFEFEGRPLTTQPIRPDGSRLQPGDSWVGPRPGIPYVLAAGGKDIYYESPALSDDEPPQIRPNTTQRVKLSSVVLDHAAVLRAVRPIADVRGHQGGRFYVNEHGAMFTPVKAGDGDGLDYIYCGQIERNVWFRQPLVERAAL
jgi:hypothetical protein